ncbi:glucans biosynthesis glucosyltransferase MdoH [Desulfatitalea alkaliphila]|uniref:Glucans biosynthesis glucosyltransferase H n=1 Tax=Desulfatitalea alkaliphila TaxID=2929485 RepID=A0AA41R5Q4_9BACT|nr:glucans biosynthesis glucosyltransferase MdoH [Desulfatitalea alkaliphila]MCJ8501545.1 glucans biosynthesis glucosyltransferase MdoH [Desulfatitalea alkaliphila]
MDSTVTSIGTRPKHAMAMPPEAPRPMPRQDLHRAPEAAPALTRSVRSWFARLLVIAITAGMAGYGIYEMLGVVDFLRMTILQGVMLVFFAITFTWIAFAAAGAVVGMFTPRARFSASDSPGDSRTALVMPVYNENPLQTTAALQAMAEALSAQGAAQHFEIVVLSDSTRVDVWVAETIAVHHLRRALAQTMPVWYRRRWRNTGRKAGNIAAFVERWGGRYDYMVVLDADSLMAAETLLALVNRMEADPRLGLLQTVPALVGQWSLFARLQQFAGRIYGGIIARGVAAWSGDDGNYWGHNAIIRLAAFAQACGLPVLTGKQPFGGHVMSHDFVEAALMRRAGWKVRMACDLGGSWEESPPSLVEAAVRDRRWAQGNLQHSKVIGASGLRIASRVHFLMGIMSYLSAPLWLLLLLTGFALTLQATLMPPEYFIQEFQLFPDWPRFDAVRMVKLFIFSMIVLLLPKMLGIVHSLFTGHLRRGSGGVFGIVAGSIVETLFAAMFAPIMMLVQTQHIIQILTGRDSGWGSQRRAATGIAWHEAWSFHWQHTLIGLGTAGVAYWLSPVLLAWLSPTLVGLVLAVPLSKASGSTLLGRWLARCGLLRIAEETHLPEIIRRRDEIVRGTEPLPGDGLRHLARDRQARLNHITCNLPPPPDPRGAPDEHRLTAAAKLADAHTLAEAMQWLTPDERLRVAADATLLERLTQLPDDQSARRGRP